MILEKDDRLILITNDDGLYAAGLKTLSEVMEDMWESSINFNHREHVGNVAGSYS